MIFRVIIALVGFIIVEFFFVRTLFAYGRKLFKNRYNTLRKVIWGALIWSNIYPLAMLVYFVLVFLLKVNLELPANAVIDYLIVYPFWVFFILAIQVDVLLLLLLLIAFIYRLVTRRSILEHLPKAFYAIVVFFAVYVPCRVIYDYHAVDVNNIRFVKNSLPEALDELRIVFMSDVQADAHTDEDRLMSFVEKVNETSPDIVLIGGDMITGSPDYIDLSAKVLSRLKSKYGVYSCVGDHDNWAYRSNPKRSIREIKSAFAGMGIPILDNQNIYIPVKGNKILVSAITNTYVKSISNQFADSLIKNKRADVKILLTHQPRERLMNIASSNEYDMYLAGHTHGGQITILFPFFNLSPTLLETKYVKGDFNFNNMFVYVTRGLGMSIAPVRYNSTPEITVITLSKK